MNRHRGYRSVAAGGLILAAGLILAGSAGCSANNEAPYVTPERLDSGLIVILPGLEGPSMNNSDQQQGLYDSGLPYAIHIYDWIGSQVGVSYAFDQPACRRKAAEVAAFIADYQAHHPGRPVFLLGHSGGGAIAVFAAEAMPEGHALAGLVTMAAALSPEYDLSKALVHCGGRMANFYTPTDWFLRGLTGIGQNLDGVPGATAGYDGFRLPANGSAQRARLFSSLRQISWNSSMIQRGNLGGHFGWASHNWIMADLAPILREWAPKYAARPAGQPAASATGPQSPADPGIPGQPAERP
ncbi:MAG: hypothetical protein BIFFINMI_01767 [Phycisphaerae bacterium]|nr:hypothetical protein [Phycisphaerae bacterium]